MGHFATVLIHSINLNIKPGQLVAVVGHVGAGKSSLISALLGEMEKMTGNVIVKVMVTYFMTGNLSSEGDDVFKKCCSFIIWDSVSI